MNAQDSQLLPLPEKTVKVTGECWWVVHFSLVEKKSSTKPPFRAIISSDINAVAADAK